jgi:hypothetical protein
MRSHPYREVLATHQLKPKELHAATLDRSPTQKIDADDGVVLCPERLVAAPPQNLPQIGAIACGIDTTRCQNRHQTIDVWRQLDALLAEALAPARSETTVGDAKQAGWPTPTANPPISEPPKTPGEFLRLLHNGIAHGNLQFREAKYTLF